LLLNQFLRQLFGKLYVFFFLKDCKSYVINQESTSLPMTKWKSYPDQGLNFSFLTLLCYKEVVLRDGPTTSIIGACAPPKIPFFVLWYLVPSLANMNEWLVNTMFLQPHREVGASPYELVSTQHMLYNDVRLKKSPLLTFLISVQMNVCICLRKY